MPLKCSKCGSSCRVCITEIGVLVPIGGNYAVNIGQTYFHNAFRCRACKNVYLSPEQQEKLQLVLKNQALMRGEKED